MVCAAITGEGFEIEHGPSGLVLVVGCDCRDCTYAALPGVPIRGYAQSNRSIAKELKTSQGHVSQLLQRGLAKLERNEAMQRAERERAGSGR